jgi:hypothetical protein
MIHPTPNIARFKITGSFGGGDGSLGLPEMIIASIKAKAKILRAIKVEAKTIIPVSLSVSVIFSLLLLRFFGN